MKYDGVEKYCSKEREILIYDEDRAVIQPPPSPLAMEAVPSLADAVGYRPPKDGVRIWGVRGWEPLPLAECEEEFRQMTTSPVSSSDEGAEE